MKLTMLVTVWVGLAMVTTLYAKERAEAPAMPVEVKKTVDSLAGHWIFDGSDTEPGAKQSAKVTMVIDCKRLRLVLRSLALSWVKSLESVRSRQQVSSATVRMSGWSTGWKFPRRVNTTTIRGDGRKMRSS